MEHKPDITRDSTPPEQPSPKAGKFVSHGWRIHNELTYRVIDWLLNSTLGVAFTYFCERTRTGQEYLTKPVTSFFTTLLKPVLKESSLEGGAKWGFRFTSITIGGFSIIPLVMFMENKKVKKSIVRWIDKQIHGKDFIESNPKFEESYNNIDKEPEKNLKVGMLTRFISLAPLLALTVIPSTHKWLQKTIYYRIGNVTRVIAENIGIKAAKMNAETLVVDGVEKTKWEYLHKDLIGFDFGLTFFYAFIHEFTYKALASMGIKQTKPAKHNSAAGEVQHEAVNPEPVSETPAARTFATEKALSGRPVTEKAASHARQVANSRMETLQASAAI